MKRLALLLILLACATSCRRQPPAPKPADAASPPQATVAEASWREPPITNEAHRRAWNEAAGELFDLAWVADRGEPGRIDVAAGDLAMPASQRARFGQPEQGPLVSSPELDRAIALVDELLEKKRRDAVSAALAEQAEAHATFDLAALSRPEREAAVILGEAASLANDLYRLQNHPMAIAFEAELIREGDVDAIRFFRRAGGPASPRLGDALYASAMKRLPDRMIAAAMWPDGMSAQLARELAGGGNPAHPLLSPFTCVKRQESGALMGIPYGAYPPFASAARAMARRLEEAASVAGLDAAVKAHLERLAQAMTSTAASPFDEALSAWASAGAPLEVVAGPFGRGRDPYGVKGFYEFVLARQNERGNELLAKIRTLLPKLEAATAAAAGESYAPRQIAATPVRAVDVLLAGGFASGDAGPELVIAPAGETGVAPARLVAINHHEAWLPVVGAAGKAALAPALAAQVDAGGMATLSMLQALAGELGPQADGLVSSGRTAAEALGPALAPLRAALSDAQALVGARLLSEGGIISQEELRRVVASHLATLVAQLRPGGDAALAAAAAVELSYLAWHGALREQGTKLAVVAERLPAVVDGMLSDLARTLATGNPDSAAQLIISYPARMPDAIAVALASLEAAKTPRGVAIAYHLAGVHP